MNIYLFFVKAGFLPGASIQLVFYDGFVPQSLSAIKCK